MPPPDLNALLRDPAKLIQAIDRAEFEDSLYLFLRTAWQHIDPAPWTDGWPIEAIAEHLQAVVDGDIKRLIINIPPRMGKSSICSVALPAWTWAQPNSSATSGPSVPFLHASYSYSLSLRDSRRCRDLIQSAWYQSYWGHRFQLNSDQNTKHRFTNDKNGERLITSISSGVTGEGGNCFAGGTLVSTPSGPKPIEAIRAGDDVLAFDHLRGMVVKSKVKATASRTSDDIHTLCTTSGYSFRCTGDHPVFSPGRGYVTASALGRSDRLIVVGYKPRGAADQNPASAMRQLRRGSGQTAVRNQKSAQPRERGRLLFERLLFGASLDQARQAMRGLWRACQCSTFSVLFRGLQKDGEVGEAQEAALSPVRRIVQWLDGALLASVCGQNSFRADAGFRQFQFQTAGALFEPVQTDAGDCGRARRLSLRGVRNRGQDDQAWRSVAFDPPCASHRREQSEQCTREPDHALPAVPRQAPQGHIDHVASVARDGGNPERVYDIQVEGRSNFFANGVLVHNCIIIDDPNAANEAFSEATIQTTIDWWDTTMSTRLNDPKTGAYIIIQQRLAENDLTGHVLSKDVGEWTHLCLPMHYEPDRSFTTVIGWTDPREVEGELLWPERFGDPEVKALERSLGPFASAGQLEQRPEPKGGGVIKREWWTNWKEEAFPPMDYILASLDTAYTEKTENDYSALTVWGVFTTDPIAVASRFIDDDGRPQYIERTYAEQTPKIMLMNAWQERLPLHELVERVAKTCKTLKVDHLLVENKASGISVAQEIRRLYGHADFGVQLIDPKGQDKLARLYSCQHIWAEGLIYAPDRTWADMVITQVAGFPHGKHDDLVDTCSQAVRYLRDRGLIIRPPERIAEIDASKQYTGRTDAPLYPA